MEEYPEAPGPGGALGLLYMYLFGEQWQNEIKGGGTPIFEADVEDVFTKIRHMNSQTDKKIRILNFAFGEKVPWPFLIACDWDDNMFIVTQRNS